MSQQAPQNDQPQAPEQAADQKPPEQKVRVFSKTQYLDAFSAHQNGGVLVEFQIAALGTTYCVAPTVAAVYEYLAKHYLKARKLNEKEALLAGHEAISARRM